MRKGPAGLLLLAALAAGCGSQDESAPAAKPETSAVPATQPDDGAQQWDEEIPKRAISVVSAIPPSGAELDRALRGVVFARDSSNTYEVAHEARQQDLRDTRRVYDAERGAMMETPIDGTTNPAKVLQNVRWRESAANYAHRDAVLLAETHRRFRELFAEKLKLRELPADRLPLRVIVLWNRESFDQVLHKAGAAAATRVRALWVPTTQTVLTYHGDDAFQELDEWRCADGRVQKECDQVLAGAATAQLLREYAGVRRGGLVERDELLGPPWFTKGLAELLGGVEVGRDRLETLEGAAWQHERIVLTHVVAGRQDRDLSEKWTIQELLRVETTEGDRPGSPNLRGSSLAPGRGPSMARLFTVRAWALCHFLWNYDGGKYRDRFIDFVGRVLDGKATSEMFAKDDMGRPRAADWGDVEMEFEWYWNQLLARKVGRNRQTKEWYQPSTAPPQGTVDAEFRTVWAEKTKDRPK